VVCFLLPMAKTLWWPAEKAYFAGLAIWAAPIFARENLITMGGEESLRKGGKLLPGR